MVVVVVVVLVVVVCAGYVLLFYVETPFFSQDPSTHRARFSAVGDVFFHFFYLQTCGVLPMRVNRNPNQWLFPGSHNRW